MHNDPYTSHLCTMYGHSYCLKFNQHYSTVIGVYIVYLNTLSNDYRWLALTTYTTSSSAVTREPEHQLTLLMTVKLMPFFQSPV